MRQVFFFLSIFWASAGLQAQKVYFLAIDAEDNQAFSVIMGTKIFSSSPTGHLIIPNLSDSTYELSVNFPRNAYPEQNFVVTIRNKDKGFYLQHKGGKSWSLFDWQTQQVIDSGLPDPGNSFNEDITSEKRKDAFALMMAGVVNDSAVLFTSGGNSAVVKRSTGNKPVKTGDLSKAKQSTVNDLAKNSDTQTAVIDYHSKNQVDTLAKSVSGAIVGQASQGEPAKQVVEEKHNAGAVVVLNNKGDKKDSLPIDAANDKIITTDSIQQKGKSNSDVSVDQGIVAGKPGPKKSIITPLGDRLTMESRELIFVDSSEGMAPDTIRVIISIDKEIAAEIRPKPDSTSQIVKSEVTKNEEKGSQAIPPGQLVVIKREDTVTNTAPVGKVPDSTIKKKETVTDRKLVINNSDCRNFATDVDVDKLRIKMLAESNLDERVVLAKKVFKIKCFTTKQVKALTELFVNDKSRYTFFDAAYPFVSDAENFKELVEMLTDEYYINRFKVMVRM